jgi:hypothetical protein
MPEIFWNTCKENKITIFVTKYSRTKFNYDQLPIIANKYGVEFLFYQDGKHGSISFNMALDPLGNQKPYK